MNALPRLSQPKNPSAHFGDLNERPQMRDSTDRMKGNGKAREAPDDRARTTGRDRPATDGTANQCGGK